MEEELESLLDGEAVRVHAGFPNPAADRRGQHRALTLDFNQLLVQHPSSTYLFRISGSSWVEQGILSGDIAVINRAIVPHPTDLVIAWENDAFIIHRHKELPEGQEYWGVITSVIHTLRGKE
jgi:SOS-response transcriptional repressor LexA